MGMMPYRIVYDTVESILSRGIRMLGIANGASALNMPFAIIFLACLRERHRPTIDPKRSKIKNELKNKNILTRKQEFV